jgi:hypothetical protein
LSQVPLCKLPLLLLLLLWALPHLHQPLQE